MNKINLIIYKRYIKLKKEFNGGGSTIKNNFAHTTNQNI